MRKMLKNFLVRLDNKVEKASALELVGYLLLFFLGFGFFAKEFISFLFFIFLIILIGFLL